METPDPAYEKKVLLALAEQTKNPDETLRNFGNIKKALFTAGSAGFVIAFFLAINSITHSVVIVFVAGMAGVIIGFGILFNLFMQKPWPITAKYFDIGSIQKRLNELRP